MSVHSAWASVTVAYPQASGHRRERQAGSTLSLVASPDGRCSIPETYKCGLKKCFLIQSVVHLGCLMWCLERQRPWKVTTFQEDQTYHPSLPGNTEEDKMVKGDWAGEASNSCHWRVVLVKAGACCGALSLLRSGTQGPLLWHSSHATWLPGEEWQVMLAEDAARAGWLCLRHDIFEPGCHIHFQCLVTLDEVVFL